MSLPVIGAIAGVVTDLIDDLHTSDRERAELALQGYQAETARLSAQSEVNKVEAASGSFFASGWRPFVGWTSGGGLFYQIILRPLLGWSAENLWHWAPPPSLEMETLLTLLFGMLGLSAMRSYDKRRAQP